MKYCCKEFEIKVHCFNRHEDGTYSISVLQHPTVVGIKFCPFCGKALGPRFEVEEVWFVRDTLEDKIVARFNCPEAARKHADKCK